MPELSPFTTACGMLAALRRGEVSSAELVAQHIARRTTINGPLNAIVITDDDGARREAMAADAARARGDEAPLLGLPITVKDWLETAGWRSTAGDMGLANYVAATDGPTIARLRTAGAVIIGKTNMAVWGNDWQSVNPVFGRTNNPWDLECTPGGSTGGGAAAVAVGLTPLEIGNDIGGSVRVPPAFCGVYGHRPSETAFPRSGQLPDPSGAHLPNPVTGLGVVGPLARSAEDLALAFDVMAGPEPGEDVAWELHVPPARHAQLRGYRVAVMPVIPWVPVDDEILAARDRLATNWAVSAHASQRPSRKDSATGWKPDLLYQRIMLTSFIGGLSRRARRRISRDARREADRLNDPIMASNARAFEATFSDYIRWWWEREQRRAAFRAFFKEWDILLTPVTLVNAFRHDEAPVDRDFDERTLTINGQATPYSRLLVYAGVATLCGQPATVFPFGQTRGGLPIGLQAIGPYLEDHTPIRFAALVAEALGGFQPPPGY